MRTVRLKRAGEAASVFCLYMGRGVDFEAGGVGDVDERTARDLLRDCPGGWELEAVFVPPVTDEVGHGE